MLSDVIIRKANKSDARQLMLKQLPELMVQAIPNIVLPLLLLMFLWINTVNPVLQIIFSIPLVVWAILFIAALLYTLGQLLGVISPHSATSTQWVAVYGKKAVAEATLDTYEDYFHLNQLVVRPEFQRQGIGSLLVNQLCQQSAKPVYVQAEKRLLNFYFRLGFKRVSENELPQDLKQLFNHIRNNYKDRNIQDLVWP